MTPPLPTATVDDARANADPETATKEGASSGCKDQAVTKKKSGQKEPKTSEGSGLTVRVELAPTKGAEEGTRKPAHTWHASVPSNAATTARVTAASGHPGTSAHAPPTATGKPPASKSEVGQQTGAGLPPPGVAAASPTTPQDESTGATNASPAEAKEAMEEEGHEETLQSDIDTEAMD